MINFFEKERFREVMNLPEKDFCPWLVSTTARQGRLDQVFPLMVHYNVPLYAAFQLWGQDVIPEELAGSLRENLCAFAASEKGWRGRVGNLNSRVDPETGRLQADKNYVMGDGQVLLLLRVNATEDQFALAWLPAENRIYPGVSSQSRGEPDLLLYPRGEEHPPLDHFFLRLSLPDYRSTGIVLSPVFSRRRYARLGLELPKRELTGLSLLALGLADSIRPGGAGELVKFAGFMGETGEAMVYSTATARTGRSIGKDILSRAARLVSALPDWAERNGGEIPPLWKRFEKMAVMFLGRS